MEANSLAFTRGMTETVNWYRGQSCDEVIVIHHNDADGLAAGTILQQAFYRDSKSVRRIALEKPYPEALRLIVSSVDTPATTLLVLADFASGMIPIIEQIVPLELAVLILDHHQLSAVTRANIVLMNPLQYQVCGRSECTASSLCFYFAHTLNPWNSDLAWMGVVGIMGDGQFSGVFSLKGINQLVLEYAQKNWQIVVGDEVEYRGKSTYRLNDIVASVNALGSIGYFRGGSDIAVKGLADGWGVEVELRGNEMRAEFAQVVDKFISNVTLIKEGLLTWFQLSDEYMSYGVKTVGLLCEELIKRGVVNGSQYVLGVQPVAAVVPGVGTLSRSEDKVSMRVTQELLRGVSSGACPPLTDILPDATRALGGFVDACHPHAAATTIPSGNRDHLISEVMRRLS